MDLVKLQKQQFRPMNAHGKIGPTERTSIKIRSFALDIKPSAVRKQRMILSTKKQLQRHTPSGNHNERYSTSMIHNLVSRTKSLLKFRARSRQIKKADLMSQSPQHPQQAETARSFQIRRSHSLNKSGQFNPEIDARDSFEPVRNAHVQAYMERVVGKSMKTTDAKTGKHLTEKDISTADWNIKGRMKNCKVCSHGKGNDLLTREHRARPTTTNVRQSHRRQKEISLSCEVLEPW